MGAVPWFGEKSWNTGSIAIADREEAVREAVGGTHLPWELRLREPDAYGCELRWGTLGDATLVECRSDPVGGRRSSAELRRTDADTLAVLLVLAGRERVRQGGVAVELAAGDALVWSSHAPIDFEVIDPVHKLTLLVPTDRVAALRPGGRVGPSSLSGSNPVVRFLAGHMQTLAQVGADLSIMEGLFAVDVTLDLLVKAIAPVQNPPTGAGPAARALLDKALALITNELADPGLAPASLAVRLGITPRYLHMLFAPTGETVAGHIRRRRIERVRQELADPRRDDETVTTIAFRWGFSDSGHLSRVFRAEHGMSPTQFRKRARARWR
jgi:AraC-like DNA-binding protein